MQSQGIRIFDGDFTLSVTVCDIFRAIPYCDSLYWAVLGAELLPKPGCGTVVASFEEQINTSAKGRIVTLKDLEDLSKHVFQEYEYRIIGCKDICNIHRYNDDYNMYESCDVVIELIDCAFWEVFSKDCTIIDELAKKFNKVKFLTLDSLKKELDETEAS